MAKIEKTMLNFQLETELRDKAKMLAEKRGVSLAGMIRSFLLQEVEKEESKKRYTFDEVKELFYGQKGEPGRDALEDKLKKDTGNPFYSDL